MAVYSTLCHAWCVGPCTARINLRNGMPSRLLVVDDHKIVRMGVRTLFAKSRLFEVCGEAQNGDEAISMVPKLAPDLVILDVSMPGMNGFETATKIRLIAPLIRIVLFTIHEIPSSVRAADVDAFVSKSSNLDELLITVDRLLQSDRSLNSHSDLYTGRAHGENSSVPSKPRERRRRARSNLSQGVHIRPFDPTLPAEHCTSVNASKDGMYCVTSSKHYAQDMNVYVMSDYEPGSPMNDALTGLVVRVEKLEDDKWGVAIQIFSQSSELVQ
jgi:DNA-binding NarL/FixJ family response regulator